MYLLLDLIRYTLHGTPSADLKVSTTDWPALYTEAKKHAVMGIVWPGVHQLLTDAGPETSNLPESQLSELKTWYKTVQYNQQLYARHRDLIARLAQLYEMIGIHTMLLKGYGLSLNYPYPSFRPVGDIDIFLFKEESQDGAVGADGSSSDPRPVWQRADDMVASVLQATIDPSHDHHTIFHVEGITVENHYDFTVLTHHKSNLPLERTLKELALDHSHQTYIGNQKIYLPSPQLNALFLLRHTAGHFAAYGLRLRQVLDWAFFIKSMADPQSSDAVSAGSKKEGNIMDLPTLWQWLIPQAQQYGLDRFLAVLNQVCVEDLGFDKGLFPSLPYDKKMKDRVLQSILKGTEPEPTCIPIFLPFARTINWCRHWWKHKLCYPESFFPALITQIHTNLTHPPSPTFQEKR